MTAEAEPMDGNPRAESQFKVTGGGTRRHDITSSNDFEQSERTPDSAELVARRR